MRKEGGPQGRVLRQLIKVVVYDCKRVDVNVVQSFLFNANLQDLVPNIIR